jgi:hypothetical protein
MKDFSNFSAFRYFLIATEQLSFFDDLPERKTKAMDAFFKLLEEDQKYAHGIKDKRHLLVFSERIEPDIYVCKFGKEQLRDLFVEGENDIIEEREVNFPYVFVLIDRVRQIVLVQNKSSVFSSVNNTRDCISAIFEAKLDLRGFIFKMEEIADEKSFWNYIDSAKGVFSITFTLNSPNLFNGRIELDELLKEVRSDYNNTETTIGFSSSEPKVQVSKSNKFIADAVKYTSGGGGHWSTRLLIRGKKETKKSKDHVRKLKLPLPTEDAKKGSVDSNNELHQVIRDAFNDVETILENTSKDDKKDT